MKILVVGFPKTGKTTIIESLEGRLDEHGREFFVHFDTNEDIRLNFICHEQSHNNIGYKNCHGYMLVCDVTDMQSYKYAISICRELVGRAIDRNCIVFVANKIDSTGTSRRKVHIITAAKQFGVQQFEISARKNINIHKPLLSLAKYLLRRPTLQFVDAMHVPVMALAAASVTVPTPMSAPISESLVEESVAVPTIPSAPSSSNVVATSSSARAVSTPRRHRERTLKIVGVGDEENEDMWELLNSQRRPSCCYY